MMGGNDMNTTPSATVNIIINLFMTKSPPILNYLKQLMHTLSLAY